MLKRKFKNQLKKIVKNYFEGEYSESVKVFTHLSDEFNGVLDKEQQYQIEKFMMLFFRSANGFTYIKFNIIRI